MVNRHLRVAVGDVLDLLLLRDNLLVEKIDLLCWHRVIVGLGLLPRRRGFSPNIIEGLFAVRSELGVLELPGLSSDCIRE